MIELALYTMSTPAVTMQRVVTKRIQSVLSFWAMSLFRQLIDDLFKNLAAMFVATELIETRAGWSQQDRVAGTAMLESVGDRRIQRPDIHQGYGPFQRRFDLAGCRPDQQCGMRLLSQRVAQRRVIQTLVLPAKDHPETAGERVERLQRGIHAGSLRIVVEIDSMERADKFQAMLYGPEGTNRRRDRLARNTGTGRGDRCGEHIFDIVPSADRNFSGGHQ